MFRAKLKASALGASYLIDGQHIQQRVREGLGPRSDKLQFVAPSNVRGAAVRLPAVHVGGVRGFVQLMDQAVRPAVEAGAQIVALPELCGLLAFGAFPGSGSLVRDIARLDSDAENRRAAFAEWMQSAATLVNELYLNTLSALARGYGVVVAGGSSYVWENGRIYNRSVLFDETGSVAGMQDKLFLAPGEEEIGVSPGEGVQAFATKVGRVALLSAQDSPNYEPFFLAGAMRADLAVAGESPWGGSLEGLRYRAQETGLYILSPAYSQGEDFFLHFSGSPAIYAPLSATKGRDGLLCREDGPLAHARMDLERAGELFDIYSSDKNLAFFRANLPAEPPAQPLPLP